MTEAEYRDDIVTRIARASEIVNGLDNSKAFQLVCEDVKKNLDNIDSHWHLVPEGGDGKGRNWESIVKELRVAKMSAKYIVDLVLTYRNELNRLQAELFKLDNKETVVDKDYDGE